MIRVFSFDLSVNGPKEIRGERLDHLVEEVVKRLNHLGVTEKVTVLYEPIEEPVLTVIFHRHILSDFMFSIKIFIEK